MREREERAPRMRRQAREGYQDGNARNKASTAGEWRPKGGMPDLAAYATSAVAAGGGRLAMCRASSGGAGDSERSARVRSAGAQRTRLGRRIHAMTESAKRAISATRTHTVRANASSS